MGKVENFLGKLKLPISSIQFISLAFFLQSNIAYIINFVEFTKFKYTPFRVDSVNATPCDKTPNSTDYKRFCGYVLLVDPKDCSFNISKCSVLTPEKFSQLKSFDTLTFNWIMIVIFFWLSRQRNFLAQLARLAQLQLFFQNFFCVIIRFTGYCNLLHL